ncbi:hypothetical protein B0A55_04719 [Friedmanniomyces simplex]|uniref:Peptidase S54 rhomboid domain-containing protein n=1 Tax=Friedmanniomyces simplex TaxID=329884 RepID=A0A4V5NHB7_9PEZI|nr:hypothetical protein B0A55_04719 [Friedmanniomyces simplex]
MSDGLNNRAFFHQSFESHPTLRGGNTTNRCYTQGYGHMGNTRRSALSAAYLIIALNTGVFAGWQYAQMNRDQRLLRTLHENFTLSWQNLREGRQWTLLTSAFSHIAWWHFAFNMLTFSTFGTMLSWIPGIGAAHMLALSLGSGIAGSAAWLYQKQVSTKIWGSFGQGDGGVRKVALGASGMVMGAGAAAACLMPFAPISVMFIPMPLWVATVGFAAVDTYFLHSGTTGIGHAAHLGGAFWGVAYYLCFLRGYGGKRGDCSSPRLRKRTTNQTPSMTATLLRTSRQTHAEAAPILYGANTFHLYDEKLLHGFLQSIGELRKHLRRIQFGIMLNAARMRSALHLLKQAKQLDPFECSAMMLTKVSGHANHVKTLLPWLKTLQKGARGAEGRKEALEIFTVDQSPKGLGSEGPAGNLFYAEQKRKPAELMASLRQALGSE